jgi:hypothetical protein
MDAQEVPLEALVIDDATRDITPEVFNEFGNLKIMPASFYQQTTVAERCKLCVRHGLYCLPTEELVQYLRDFIGARRAIEIGAGNGVLAKALGIPATDNRMQEMPHYRKKYEALQQQPVRYGDNVERLDASVAVKRYQPKVVIGAWVTHRYDPKRHAAGGNEMGIVEEAIIKACDTYVMIGNESVHRAKSIWSLPHDIDYPSWLYSRAYNGTRDFIATWSRR